MKSRTKWVLLALIAVLAIVLTVALLRGCAHDPASGAPAEDAGTAADPSSQTSEEASPEQTEENDLESGPELEEDELPIMTN